MTATAGALGPTVVGTGVLTAAAGLGALALPRNVLRIAFSVAEPGAPTLFFVRHWGLLIALVGALTVAGGAIRPDCGSVLIAAAIEKTVLVGLIVFGPLERTPLMTVLAFADGAFALLYIAYLTGL